MHKVHITRRVRGSMDRIVDGLYIGDEDDARDRQAFQSCNVKAVINCAPRVPNAFEREGVAYLHLSIEESSEIDAEIAAGILSFVVAHEQHGSILVHCAGGNQRSPAVAMLVLASKGMPLLDAFSLVERRRGASVMPTFAMISSIARLEIGGCKVAEAEVRRYYFDRYRLLV